MSHHDLALNAPEPVAPNLADLAPQALNGAAAALLWPLLHPDEPGADATDRRLVAAFAEALRAEDGPAQRILAAGPGGAGLLRLIRIEAEGASRPGIYGRLSGHATAHDLDGPIWRADADLRAALGPRRAAALEFAHVLATHPADQSRAEMLAAGWSAAETETLARVVLLAVLAGGGLPVPAATAQRPAPEPAPDLCRRAALRLDRVLAATDPSDLDLAVHNLRATLAALEPAAEADPALALLLWRLRIVDRAFGAELVTGFARLQALTDQLLAQPEIVATLPDAGPFVAQLAAARTAVTHPDLSRLWARAFGENRIPQGRPRTEIHLLGRAVVLR